MPRRTLASDASSKQYLSRSGDMARGAPAPVHAATHSTEDIDIDIDDVVNFPANALSSTTLSTPQSSQPPRPAQAQSSQNRHTPAPPPFAQSRDKLDISPENKQTRKDLLRESFFSDWKDDASSADLGDPDEMQKKDPLGTQIWKLYSKTKSQLPNQERMENLTWRMMAMNLKRKEREQARYVQAQASANSRRGLWLTQAHSQGKPTTHQRPFGNCKASRVCRPGRLSGSGCYEHRRLHISYVNRISCWRISILSPAYIKHQCFGDTDQDEEGCTASTTPRISSISTYSRPNKRSGVRLCTTASEENEH